jgi:hypothetical protein
MGYQLFQPTVEPIEVCALPENAILGFEYPVVLVGEEQQFGFDAQILSRIEGCNGL